MNFKLIMIAKIDLLFRYHYIKCWIQLLFRMKYEVNVGWESVLTDLCGLNSILTSQVSALYVTLAAIYVC